MRVTPVSAHGRSLRMLALAGALCAVGHMAVAAPPVAAPLPDEQPLYGGVDRNKVPELRRADERFISEVSELYGSRQKAARVWIDQGFKFYQKNEFGMAMRRFNQAWLLDPANAEPYAGFASVLHDQGRTCEAMHLMEEALKRNPPPFQGIYPDAARITALCALNDSTLQPPSRNALLQRSETLYQKAEQVESNKGYVYASWANAYYWRGLYAEAWAMVTKERAVGGKPAESFLGALRSRMAEPVRP